LLTFLNDCTNSFFVKFYYFYLISLIGQFPFLFLFFLRLNFDFFAHWNRLSLRGNLITRNRSLRLYLNSYWLLSLNFNRRYLWSGFLSLNLLVDLPAATYHRRSFGIYSIISRSTLIIFSFRLNTTEPTFRDIIV